MPLLARIIWEGRLFNSNLDEAHGGSRWSSDSSDIASMKTELFAAILLVVITLVGIRIADMVSMRILEHFRLRAQRDCKTST